MMHFGEDLIYSPVAMAQTCQMPRNLYHSSSSPHSSTALMFFPAHSDGKQQQAAYLQPLSSSFYRSNDSVELLKSHQIRVLSYVRVRHVIKSQSCRTDHQPCNRRMGKNIWSLELRGSDVFRGGNGVLLLPIRQRRVCLQQALPRPTSFLPSAGPLRDFLFATIGAVFAFLFAGILARLWCLEERYFKDTAAERGTAVMPEMGSNPGQKESVEWVNMVIHKIWKVYRRSLEVWLVQLLQPAIDNLGKPDYVKRVQIAELNLDCEPLIVRNVQRRASRRANDLQYHFGLRYTGGARCLLNLKLGKAGVETLIPVGVYDLDVDAELWLKLRLAPVKPYVGTLSLAFVRLPTIKLVLAPFRVVNLFSIPFLSNFLSKLLTVDLPRLLVLPRHITFDFMPQGQNVMDSVEAMEASLESGQMDESIASGVLDLLKTGTTETKLPQAEPSEAFVGELSVTVCDARDLPIRGFTGWSNPYCILALGDQVLESKRNKETSHPAGHKDPVWNQDFQFLVEDPRRQKLMIRVRDSTLTLNPNIGYCQINLAELKDCVPRTLWVNLKRDGPFGAKKVPGRVRLALTYKSYVDEDAEESGDEDGSFAPYIKVYGDSGAESVEDIGVSLGEEISASLREEAKGGGGKGEKNAEDIEVMSTYREDSSVEVTSSPKTSTSKSEKGHERNRSAKSVHNRDQNGAASRAHRLDRKHSMEQGRRKSNNPGNGALSQGERHADSERGSQHFTKDGNAIGRLREEAAVGSATQGGNGSLQGTPQDVNAASTEGMLPASSKSVLKGDFDESDTAEVGAEDHSAQQVPRAEGNPLVWLCVFTTVAYIFGCSLHISNPLHP